MRDLKKIITLFSDLMANSSMTFVLTDNFCPCISRYLNFKKKSMSNLKIHPFSMIHRLGNH